MNILVVIIIVLTIWQLAMMAINTIACGGPLTMFNAFLWIATQYMPELSFKGQLRMAWGIAWRFCLWPGWAIAVKKLGM